MTRREAKQLLLRVARALGAFRISRWLTSRELRIICYHGVAIQDENQFSPGLFIDRDVLAERMDFLRQLGYPVLALDDALAGLENGSLESGSTVITIDDGWYGTYSACAPILERHSFPATLYVASYYMEKQLPVYNVAVRYVLWRARGRNLDLALVCEVEGVYALSEPYERDAVWQVLSAIGEAGDSRKRNSVLRALCDVLGVSFDEIEAKRICCFVDVNEARELLGRGVDIQLHTHRHRFGTGTFDQAEVEIADNRQALSSVTDQPLKHFCFPSGIYNADQASWLKRLGIESATTTRKGLNRSGCSKYELRRFLDSEKVSAIEFEAEMSGFNELLRRSGIAR